MKLINIGFGSLVSAGRLVAVVSPDSAPIKRMAQEARERGILIDSTYGHKTALEPEVIAGRLEGREPDSGEEKP